MGDPREPDTQIGPLVNEGALNRVAEHVRDAVAKGATVAEASRQIGVTEQTLYRWRKEYGGMRVDQARRLKDLEAENARLKKLVADLSLDKMILAEVSKVRF